MIRRVVREAAPAEEGWKYTQVGNVQAGDPSDVAPGKTIARRKDLMGDIRKYFYRLWRKVDMAAEPVYDGEGRRVFGPMNSGTAWEFIQVGHAFNLKLK